MAVQDGNCVLLDFVVSLIIDMARFWHRKTLPVSFFAGMYPIRRGSFDYIDISFFKFRDALDWYFRCRFYFLDKKRN
jgi:hypothetical protein